MTPSRRRWFGLVAISLAVALIIVDSTIVNVAVPSIVDDLGITSSEVQWVQESYTLVFASFLLVFGALADRFGRRRLLLLGVALFAGASVFAALAPSGELLIAARVLQGVGGSMVLPTTLSLINATFTGRERGIAFAVWGSTIGGMVAVGPLLGGWLTTYFSWRWSFGINIPLGVLIVIGLLLFVDASRAAGGRESRIDGGGAALSVLASATLVFGLIEGRTFGWWLVDERLSVGSWTWPFDLSPVPLAFAVSAVALIAFVVRGIRRERAGRPTLLAFGLFRIASFRNGNIAALIVSLGEFGIVLSLPLWLQNVLGYDALQTGFVLLALAGGSFVASGVAGATSGKVSPVTTVRAGLVAEIVGVLGIALVIGTTTPWWAVAPFLFVYGIGVGLATAQLTGVVLADVPPDLGGAGSGTQSTFRQIGSALGIAVLGTVLFTSTGSVLDGSLEADGVPAAQRDRIVTAVVDSAGAAIPGFDQQSADTAAAAREAFSDATRYAAFTAAGFLLLGLGATLRLKSTPVPAGRRDTATADTP